MGDRHIEDQRLATLTAYRILDSGPDPVFDELADLAARVCDTPMAILTFIDADRQWFKAAVGLDLAETPREIAFCDHTIRDRESLVVPDAGADQRFADNPLVQGEPGIRFYAGVPLVAPDGWCIGSLAVLDTRSRTLDASRIEWLHSLARLAMHQVELRLDRIDLAENLETLQALTDAVRERDDELQQAHEALRLSEQRYRHVTEASQAALWDYDMIADRMEFSQAFCEMLGYESPGDMPRSYAEYLELVHPEDLEQIRAAGRRLVAGETADRASVEFRLQTLSGEYRWMRASSKVIRDADGKAIRRLGSTVDIHDRKVAEQQTRQLAERLTTTLESMTDAFFTVDAQWRFTFINRQAERLLGRTRDELLGRGIWDEFAEAVDLAFYREYHRAVSDQCTVEFEEFYAPLDSWFEVTAYPTGDGLAVYFRDVSEKRKVQQQLRESEQRFRTAARAATDVVWDLDLVSGELWWSEGMQRVFGYPPEEAGTDVASWEARIHPDDRREATDSLNRAIERGGTEKWTVRYRFRRRDGSYADVIDTGFLIHDSDGRAVRMVGGMRDVTRQRRAEQALAESERRYRLLFEANPHPMWVFDRETLRFLAVNDAAIAHYGYSRKRFLSMTIADIRPPEDVPLLRESLERTARERLGSTGVWRHLKADGTQIEVEISGHALTFDGRPAEFILAQDVTARRQHEVKLAEQARLLDEANDAILVRDSDHRIQFWNKGAERIYGWTAAHAIGKRVTELLFVDGQTFARAHEEFQENRHWEGRFRHRRRDGSEVVVESRWSQIYNDAGQPVSVLAINTDITERLSVEEQLRQSQRLDSLGQLTGGVAHDFNNLLTVILGNAELLSDHLESQPRLKRLADMTRSAAQRGADLTNRLLAFARRQTLEPRVVDVAALVDDMQPLLRQSVPDNVSIRLNHPPERWHAEIDPAQLEASLLNLTLNARDAMPDGGRLTIEIANVELDREPAEAELEPGEYVRIDVADTGTGIPPERMGRLFEPFYTTKKKGKGTGLGLPMVYGFVKQSNGHIRIDSQPGEGTRVRILLPRAAREPEPGDADTNARHGTLQQHPRQAGERVLIVEDDELVREHAERLLVDYGYRVTVAADGAEALELLCNGMRFDLLFTDVIMPGTLNGPELVRAAREIHPELRVLFTSGYTENAIAGHGELDDQAVHLLQKPYRRDQLARKVREVLDG